MIRTPLDGAGGVAVGSATYWCVLGSHTNVLPRSVGGMTLAGLVGLKAEAASRIAWSRAAASAYGWFAVRGGTTGAAPSSAPVAGAAPMGEPVAVRSAAKLWSVGDVKTLETVWRSEVSCCGLESWGCGPLESLHAAATSATVAARAHQVRRRYAGMLLLRRLAVWERRLRDETYSGRAHATVMGRTLREVAGPVMTTGAVKRSPRPRVAARPCRTTPPTAPA